MAALQNDLKYSHTQALLKLQITPNYGIAIFLKMNVRALLDNLFFLIDIQTILRIILI